MHIQPMEQHVTITKSAKSSINKGSSMSYAYNNFDITRSLEEIKQQNDVKNKFLLAITGLLTLGTILIPASIYLKGGGGSKSSTQSIYGLVRNFENLSKNEKIPTLATCKSINKKLKSANFISVYSAPKVFAKILEKNVLPVPGGPYIKSILVGFGFPAFIIAV